MRWGLQGTGLLSPSPSHLWAERTRITDNNTKCLLCVCTFWAINPHDSSMEKYCCCPILQLGKGVYQQKRLLGKGMNPYELRNVRLVKFEMSVPAIPEGKVYIR